MKKVKIALLGLGNVGKGVLSIIRENKEQIVKRSGYEVEISKILIKIKIEVLKYHQKYLPQIMMIY